MRNPARSAALSFGTAGVKIRSVTITGIQRKMKMMSKALAGRQYQGRGWPRPASSPFPTERTHIIDEEQII